MNTTKSITCHECRALLPDWLERELPHASRSQVAAHLDGCDRCHAVYVRQRGALAGLQADLPALGRLQPAQAGQLWRAVQHDLLSPRRAVWPFSQRRVGLLAVLVAAALLLPWLLSPGRLAALALPMQPTPVSSSASATDAPLAELLHGAGVAIPLTPPSQPEYAPTQAAARTIRPDTGPRLTSGAQAR
ncbi:MAG: zf-HC2 domain-containing protein [Anaerolineae bacterium]|nr:zf-HC2 domain-containing protein [Anaerolineae bacterium]